MPAQKRSTKWGMVKVEAKPIEDLILTPEQYHKALSYGVGLIRHSDAYYAASQRFKACTAQGLTKETCDIEALDEFCRVFEAWPDKPQ